MLQEQQPHQEEGLGRWPPLIAEALGQLLIDPVPVDRISQAHQLMAQVGIWSSRARNRSTTPLFSVFLGRIATLLDATRESRAAEPGNPF